MVFVLEYFEWGIVEQPHSLVGAGKRDAEARTGRQQRMFRISFMRHEHGIASSV